jgi:hypothetical protein
MSSVRNEALAVSKGDLDILDEFMLALGFTFYPGYDNKSEPANMPWSTRWCRHYTVTYTDGTKGGWHVSPDVASFLYQHLNIKSE